MPLKLFRRHETACTRKYPREERIYETDSAKLTGRAQCNCPISAEGKLVTGKYLRPKSTGSRTWSEARVVAEQWDQPEAARPQPSTSEYRLVTVPEAVDDFLKVTRANGVSGRRIGQYKHLLTLRLTPFAAAKGVAYLQETDNAQFWSDFRLSWKNENPTRNRKIGDGQTVEHAPVKQSTDSRMISDLRSFLAHGVSREWLSENWASRKHKMLTRKTIEPKEPFSEQDLLYIFRACQYVTLGHNSTETPYFGENGAESLVFMAVMRYTGLRISDVVELTIDQLVPFVEGPYTHAIFCAPRKTTHTKAVNFVHIPIPNGNVPGHPDLVSAIQRIKLKHGKYLFLNPKVLPTYCGCRSNKCATCIEWYRVVDLTTNNWRDRLDNVFNIAAKLLEQDGKSLSVKAQPHRFRHTFAATLLQAGVPLRAVASWLGDTEDVVRRHYAKFCVTEQRAAARVMAEAMATALAPASTLPLLGPWLQPQSDSA
jgi:integrase